MSYWERVHWKDTTFGSIVKLSVSDHKHYLYCENKKLYLISEQGFGLEDVSDSIHLWDSTTNGTSPYLWVLGGSDSHSSFLIRLVQALKRIEEE